MMKNAIHFLKLVCLIFLSVVMLMSCGNSGSSGGNSVGSGEQSLEVWNDQSTPTKTPVTDLRVAMIATNATDGGAALTSTTVSINGTITAIDDIKVWWNTVDDIASATVAGSLSNPGIGVSQDIALTGAGAGSGFLYYTISIPSEQEGDYSVTVFSVAGATDDNIPLPQITINREVGFFVTLTADKTSPATLETVGTIIFTAEANGDDVGGNYDYQFWLQEISEGIWDITQDYGNGNTWNWTPAEAGSYKIAVWAKNLDDPDDEALSWMIFEVNNDPVQTLDGWSSEATRVSAPVTDLEMAKIISNAAYGGVALISTKVAVTGTITAVDDINVWWNTVDDLASATLVGSHANPVVGVAYDIALTGAGAGSGFLFYTISIHSGQNDDYYLTVSGVTGATTDNIPLPQTTMFPVDHVMLTADRTSPALLAKVDTVTFTAEANGDDAGGNYDYQFWIQEVSEGIWNITQDYGNGNIWKWTPTEAGNYKIAVWAKNAGSSHDEAITWLLFDIIANPVEYVILTANKKSPQRLGKVGTIKFTADANGDDSSGDYEYKFWIKNLYDAAWTMVQDYGNGNLWNWEPDKKGIYTIRVWAREGGTPAQYQAEDSMEFIIK